MPSDPYLLWLSSSSRLYFPTELNNVVLFVSFKGAIDDTLRSNLAHGGVQLSRMYDGYNHATVLVELSRLQLHLDALTAAGADCVSLASPTPGPRWVEPASAPVSSNGPDRVLGIIDDGCPFAHRNYRSTDAARLAVRFLWDQGGSIGANSLVSYGRALFEGELEALVAGARVDGVVDEDSAYRASGLPALRGATSHGAQVMSHATGTARPARQPRLEGRNDIAFVQLPPAALDDPSGRWMDHFALDAIHAIRFYARKMFHPPAKHVVINLSYGPQTGPHDGSSIFEKAIEQIIRNAAAEHWKLNVVVPSGNSHLSRAHAEFALARNPGPLTWCVPPDSQVPSFLELWPPVGVDLAQLEVSLTSPTGETITAVDQAPVSTRTATVTATPYCGKPNQYLVLMVIAATARPQASSTPGPQLAVPGRWKVTVTVRPGQAAAGIAHAYLARLDPNLGRKLRGRSGYLDSPNYDPKRYLRASPHLGDPPSPSPVEVAARGSLNGIATASGVKIAAGYVNANLRPNVVHKPSPYSSGGPSRRKPGSPPHGPDYAYPTDDSPVLAGRLAGGNRGGTVTRMVGTSFAAPMYALDLLDPGLATELPLPASKPKWFKNRCGKGQRLA